MGTKSKKDGWYEDYPCPIERPGRISAVADENPEDYRVRISDLDVNRHLTTTQYIAHLLDRFPLEKFDEERVDRFEVQFLNEVLYDERVLLLKQKIEKGEYALEMRNEQGVSCCKCKCVFVKNEPGEE